MAEKKTVQRKKQLDMHMLVPVKNVTDGKLSYISKRTGAELHWEQYGDVEFMEVAEIVTMRSSQPRFVREPFIMIEDEEVVEYLGLTKLYEEIPENVEELLELSVEEMKAKLEKLPLGLAVTLISVATTKAHNGELDSSAKIQAIESKYNVTLR
jgi:hypothetical protein